MSRSTRRSGWNTTIELRLDVAQNINSPTTTSLFARFDHVEINKRSDVVFADGFEALTHTLQ